MKKQLDIYNTFIHFECPTCKKNRDICTVDEVVRNGSTICSDCNKQMEVIEFYSEK